ncbi:hypothetical protein ABZ726_05335 [Streptomyces hundungensis]|uniref:hypothetical protein n=1 Tax=Streptomyces hundungensis TaxID=1077946 RepID=UPI0033CFF1AC
MTTVPDTGFALPMSMARHPSLAQAPYRSVLPQSLHVKRTARYVVNVGAGTATQACTVARALFPTVLGRAVPAQTIHLVLTALSELASIGAARTRDDTLLCELWKDEEHVFVSIEHDTHWSGAADTSGTTRWNKIKMIAEDCGSHVTPAGYQIWAAIRIR